MDCPDCRRQIPSDSLFCCYCGESLQRCDACERFFTCSAAFCGGCGSPLKEAQAPTFSPPTPLDDNVIGFLYESTGPQTNYALSTGDTTVGAGGNNDIIIERPAVSWNHAILIGRDDRISVQDSASTNGTFLNGTRIRVPRRLSQGDIIRFGSEEFHVWLRPSAREVD